MKLNPHLAHYVSLWSMLGLGLLCLLWFRYNHPLQLTVVILMGLYYLLWGIIHHYHHGDLHPKIVVEYLLISILAILVIGSILLWG